MSQERVLRVGWGLVPGPNSLDTDELEDGYPTWRAVGRVVAQLALARRGIEPKHCVVIRSDKLIAGARVAWILRRSGFERVELEDVEGDRLDLSGAPCLEAVSEDLMAFGRLLVGDVRSLAEFNGETSGYSYVEARGHIPGSFHLGDADDEARIYTAEPGRFRDPRQIESMWASRGVLRHTPVTFTCGGGWRAALAWCYAAALGFHDVRVHAEGWAGWSTTYTREPDGTWSQKPSGRPFL